MSIREAMIPLLEAKKPKVTFKRTSDGSYNVMVGDKPMGFLSYDEDEEFVSATSRARRKIKTWDFMSEFSGDSDDPYRAVEDLVAGRKGLNDIKRDIRAWVEKNA